MRLDKYLCESTELSRTLAKRAIGKGNVTVNGELLKDPSFKVSDSDTITLNDETLSVRGQRYIMLYKPEDMICSTVDEEYPSVLNLLIVDKPETLHIAGRLDADTTGLVLITDDGQWSHKVTSPRNHCKKAYRAALAEAIDESAIEQFKQGIMLNNEAKPTLPAALEIIGPHEVILTIEEGKYHQVKRMFAAIGNKVTELHRISIGGIELDHDMEPGEWRFLEEDEVASIS